MLADERTNRITELNSRLKEIGKEMSNIHKELNELQPSRNEHLETFKVSDHAVVRYLEREHDINISKLKEKILDEHSKMLISKGHKVIPVGKHALRIRNHQVATYY